MPPTPRSDLRAGDQFDHIGIGDVGDSIPDVERVITVVGCSVYGDLSFKLSVAGTDQPGREHRLHMTPYDRALLLIEQGIWKPRKA